MWALLRLETRKIWRRPLLLFALAGLALYFIYGEWTMLSDWSDTTAIVYSETGQAQTLRGLSAIRAERRRTEALAGEWTDETLRDLWRRMEDLRADPAYYSDEVDEEAMRQRRMRLWRSGASDSEVRRMDREQPVYRLLPEFDRQWQELSPVRALMENTVIREDGTLKTVAQAFPGLGGRPAVFGWANGVLMGPSEIGMGLHLLLAAVILAGVAPLFSEEYAARTDALLLSARHGRLPLAVAKLLAAGGFTVCAVGGLQVLLLVVNGFVYGFGGWELPVQLTGYPDFPWPLNAGEFLLLLSAFQLLGMLALAAVTALLSALLPGAFSCLFLGAVFYYGGWALPQLARGTAYLWSLMLPPSLMYPYGLFAGEAPSYSSGTGGLPLWGMACALALALSVGGALLAGRCYIRHVPGENGLVRAFLTPGGALHPGWKLLSALALVFPAALLVRRLGGDGWMAGRLGLLLPPLLLWFTLERRSPREMGLPPPGRCAGNLAHGFLLGTAAVAVLAALLVLTGGAAAGGAAGLSFFGAARLLAEDLLIALSEELLFRGYAVAVLARSGGPAAAVLVPAGAFALFHAMNPGFGLAAGTGCFLFALLVTAMTARTGNLYAAIGFHTAWNLTQSLLFRTGDGSLPIATWLGLVQRGGVFAGNPQFGLESGLGALLTLAGLLPWVLWRFRENPRTRDYPLKAGRAAPLIRPAPRRGR